MPLLMPLLLLMLVRLLLEWKRSVYYTSLEGVMNGCVGSLCKVDVQNVYTWL
jgi:hypothetical protein